MTTAAALHWPLPTYAPQRLIDFWKFDQFQCVLSQLGVLCCTGVPGSCALKSHVYKYFYSQLKATISSFCKQNLKSGYHLSFPLKDWGKFSQCQQVNIFILSLPEQNRLWWADGRILSCATPLQILVTPLPAAVSNWYLWNISTLHRANPFNVPSFIDKHFTEISNI